MQVERLFEQVKDRRVLIELPDSFNNHWVEIIVLTTDAPRPVHRHPHPEIAGRTKIRGDILTSCIPRGAW